MHFHPAPSAEASAHICRDLAALAALAVMAPAALVGVLDGASERVVASVGLSVTDTPPRLTRLVPADGAPVALAAPPPDPIIPATIVVEAALLREDGARIGTLQLWRNAPGAVEARDLTIVHGIAAQIVHELGRAEAERQHIAMERAAILERVTEAYFALDRDGRIIDINDRAAATFDRVPEDLVGRVMWEEFGETLSQRLRDGCERVLRTQIPITIEDFYEPHARWYEDRIFPSHAGLSVFFSDITERKTAEHVLTTSAEQLRRLTQRLQVVREEEQAHLSRELHDRLGQSLTMLKLGLSRVTALIARQDPAALDRAKQLNAEVDALIDTTRRISSDLRPPMLDDFGLASALEWAGQRFASRTGLLCVTALDECDVSTDAARAMYAITQEALTNVVRHAAARCVTLRLRQDGDDVVLSVLDDGVGISEAAALGGAGLGLLGLRERAAAIGATVTVARRDAGGSKVEVRCPVGAQP